jgi:hypothetical protein
MVYDQGHTLCAVLNQITGKSFELVYNGSIQAEREADRKHWQDWRTKTCPEKASICRSMMPASSSRQTRADRS